MPPKSDNPPVGPLGGIAPGLPNQQIPADVIAKLQKDPAVWTAIQEELAELQKAGGLSDAAREKMVEAMQERVKNQDAPPCTFIGLLMLN
jgi:hypothetical protein